MKKALNTNLIKAAQELTEEIIELEATVKKWEDGSYDEDEVDNFIDENYEPYKVPYGRDTLEYEASRVIKNIDSVLYNEIASSFLSFDSDTAEDDLKDKLSELEELMCEESFGGSKIKFVSKSKYWEMFEVLPPENDFHTGAFMGFYVPECSFHWQGVAYYSWYVCYTENDSSIYLTFEGPGTLNKSQVIKEVTRALSL